MELEKGKVLEKIKRIWRYLLGDFPFIENFRTSLDYEAYWEARGEEASAFPSKFKLLADIIEPGSTVLDIGCGDGTLLEYLGKEKGIKGLGVEISQKAIELAKAKGVEVIKADITKDDFELAKTFDYVIMADVLEHIPNPEKVVLKLAKNCKIFFLITLPNTGFLGDRLRLLFGRFPKQWVFHPGEHLRFWSVKDFVVWCRELGFKVNKVIGIPDEYYSFLNWFSLYKIMPSIFSRYVWYIVSKRE